ncbi:MAG: 30S ribosomal protein S12 methylthiotransferase RimO [Candidatus Cloacimonetes bacterium]|nr:30S ribosomal protein S12 methylthiotransferase RimO [Candidatus Cloacimonadota bacterium]MCF7813936.1 30S ribosomal protein S12 methylthiotransferase RimO [Candidatus Cloacimonadota bacterium]MCF7868030.1 30S ribosomal protein S12 methylthiotransferase RimO [Candidatus Cloacimonadota bacterium]MCF7883950.1 30S ribosomal protein S12 methylthiotransferase RimO [Candidatus Cloacimonadota bacterium]
MKKYSIVSLGCSKNLVDSEVFSAIASKAGFTFTQILDDAEIIVVNTCGFIIDAKEESINTILEMADYKETGKCKKLIVTGCLVKRYFNDLEESIPEIDELIDLKDFDKFAEIFQTNRTESRKLLTPLHFAYLRISDGCNNHCSYCAIPSIRGQLQSEPMQKLIDEAKSLADRGVKELILTAQDSARYGFDLYGESKLAELMTKLHEIEEIEWIRVLYLHPAHITSEIIDAFANFPKVCKYFEIPIQHINNEILLNMNRKVTRNRIEEIISEIRNKIPEAVVRTTLIVGYPGETEEKFLELKEFVEKTKFERLGVFIYSEEDGTPSAKLLNDVEEEIAEQRKDEIMSLQQQISEDFLASLIGKKIKVIIDRKGNDGEFPLEGRSYFDAPEIDGTVFIESGEAEIGDIVEVEIEDSWEYDVIGRICSPS